MSAREDDASTHVLEAVTMAIVMVTSIAFVVTFQTPPVGTDEIRTNLALRLHDVLAILNDTPVDGSTYGNNELTVGLMGCMQGDCSRLSTDLDALMPNGTRYAVYLSTGDGLFPVYVPRSPGGEAITVRRSIEPAWNYQFMTTSQSIFNPVEDPLVVYALPVASGNPVHQGGSLLSIAATGNRTADNAFYVLKTASSTRAVAAADEASAPAISLFFHNGNGTPLASRDVRSDTIDLGLLPTRAPIAFSLRVQESAAGSVPAGTLVSVNLPHGWNATASQPVNAADWLILSNATDTNGTSVTSTLTARLLHAVSNGSVDLQFNGTYGGDADDYYPITASLTAGAYSRAALLVRADAHAVQPDFEVPTLIASVPRPLGSGATTTWTLAALASEASTIDRIEIADETGRAIFASVTGLSGGGSWSTTGDKLVWTGGTLVAHDTPLNLTFNVTSTSIGGPNVDRAPFVPGIDFGNFTGAMTQEVAPGLHRAVILPASASYRGYDPSLTGVRSNHSANSSSVYRTTALPGTLAYTVGTAAGLKDAVFGSAITATPRAVSPGATVHISIEAQTIMYQLAVLGLEPSLELNVYPPWAGDARRAVVNEPLYNGTLAKGNGTFLSLVDTNGDLLPDTSMVGRLQTNVTIPAGWLYGPYVIEANVTWLETIGSGVTETVLRSARVYDYFVVEPSSRAGGLPPSPVYDVHVVTWLQDWG